MANVRDPARDEAKKIYLENKGITNREIANRLNVDEKKIATWKYRDNWDNISKKKNVVQQKKECSTTKKECSTTNEKSKINWLILENEYVTDITDSPITLKGLSEKYDISFNTVKDYSTKNYWKDKRNKYHENITKKFKEKLSNETANKMVEIMENLNSSILQATKELNIHEEVNNVGELIKVKTETIRVGKLSTLVKAAALLQKNEIEKQKLELEKKKISLGVGSEEVKAISKPEMEAKISDEFIDSYKVFNDKNQLEMIEYGGRGGGKSTNVFFFPIIRILQEPIDCLVLRKVHNTIRNSVFNQVLWCIDELGVSDRFKINYSRMEIINIEKGNGFYFRGADDPMKIKSLKTPFPVAVTIFEEVDQFKSWDEVDHIKQSVLRGDIEHFKLIYLFNPPRNKMHWCNQKWLFGNTNGVYLHKSDYRSNPYLPKQFIQEAEKAKEEDELRYRWIYLGEPIGSSVVPFPKLIIEKELDSDLVNSFDNIKQGLDWGYGGDAFAFARCHYDKRNKTIYIFGEIYGHGLSNYTTATRIKEKGWNDYIITGDSAEPKSIKEYQDDLGIRIQPTKKGAGSVETGFRWLGDHTIIVCQKRCPNIAREFQMADFKIDKDGNLTSQLVGSDHGLDAVRYAFESEYSYGGLKVLK